MRALPGAARATVEERKISEYLLNVSHPAGRAKAQFFLSVGCPIDDWQVWAIALARHADENAVVGMRNSAFGNLYQVRCGLGVPDGSRSCIRTVWLVRVGSGARLVTAYPFE